MVCYWDQPKSQKGRAVPFFEVKELPGKEVQKKLKGTLQSNCPEAVPTAKMKQNEAKYETLGIRRIGSSSCSSRGFRKIMVFQPVTGPSQTMMMMTQEREKR